jgi:hypothetical protein
VACGGGHVGCGSASGVWMSLLGWSVSWWSRVRGVFGSVRGVGYWAAARLTYGAQAPDVDAWRQDD